MSKLPVPPPVTMRGASPMPAKHGHASAAAGSSAAAERVWRSARSRQMHQVAGIALYAQRIPDWGFAISRRPARRPAFRARCRCGDGRYRYRPEASTSGRRQMRPATDAGRLAHCPPPPSGRGIAAFSARSRRIELSATSGEVTRIDATPAPTSISASSRLAQHWPMAPASIWRLAISAHLCVLACGLSEMPLARQ